MALEEGELVLALEGLDPGGARVREAEHEQMNLDQLPCDQDLGLAPVDLGLGAGVVGLGDVAVGPQAERPAAGGDVAAERALGDLQALLCGQPLVDPLGGVALLGRRGLVGLQPVIDQLGVGGRASVPVGPRAALSAPGSPRRGLG